MLKKIGMFEREIYITLRHAPFLSWDISSQKTDFEKCQQHLFF